MAEGGIVEGFVLDELAQGAFALSHLRRKLGGDRLHVGDCCRERVLVGGDEIPERPNEGINLEAGETLGEVLHPGSDVVDLLHHGAQIGLFGGGDVLVVLQEFAPRRAEINGDKVLAEQPHELDRRDAVGLHFGGGPHFHHDQHSAVRELDAFDPADFDAGHLHAVAHFEVLHIGEQGIHMLAALEHFKAAHPFQNDGGGQHDQGNEESNAGFKGVFHTLSFLGL